MTASTEVSPRRSRRSIPNPRDQLQDLRFAFAPAKLRAPLLKWYRQVRRPLPWRVLWQQHQDPYHVWVSEIMLQQTVIKAVLPVYDRFLARFPKVTDLAAADEETVRQAVRGLGYYRRFRFLHRAAQVLTTKPNWAWPTTFNGWLELPGVGDYTASAISSIAFDVPAAVVDGNVERVFSRLLDLRRSPAEPGIKTHFKMLATEFIDPRSPGDFNQALMELGQTVCTVSAPACDVCPLRSGCMAREQGSQALAPAAKLKAALRDVQMRLLIPQFNGKIGLIDRPDTARFLKGTRGFLTVLQKDDGEHVDGHTAARIPKVTVEVGAVRHTITQHRIAARVEMVKKTALPNGLQVEWLAPQDVEERLISNLDRKAWHVFTRKK